MVKVIWLTFSLNWCNMRRNVIGYYAYQLYTEPYNICACNVSWCAVRNLEDEMNVNTFQGNKNCIGRKNCSVQTLNMVEESLQLALRLGDTLPLRLTTIFVVGGLGVEGRLAFTKSRFCVWSHNPENHGVKCNRNYDGRPESLHDE